MVGKRYGLRNYSDKEVEESFGVSGEQIDNYRKVAKKLYDIFCNVIDTVCDAKAAESPENKRIRELLGANELWQMLNNIFGLEE